MCGLVNSEEKMTLSVFATFQYKSNLISQVVKQYQTFFSAVLGMKCTYGITISLAYI